MYAVIFRAEINYRDEEYTLLANRMRQLASEKYGCVEFTTLTEGNHEIAISYWENRDQIIAWKQDPEHLQAQQLGRDKWYKSYKVQIVKIQHEYNSS